MRIESGTTRERRTRVLIMFLACLVFAAWFAYDAWIGYPRDNELQRQAEKPPEHTSQDILTQRGAAALFGTLAIIAGVHLIRVLRTHAVLNDEGLVYNRAPLIGWDQMTGLEASQYEAKGRVELIYQSSGTESRRRLDTYHLGAFDDIIDEICHRKGFANPLPEPEERGPAIEEPPSDEDAPPAEPNP